MSDAIQELLSKSQDIQALADAIKTGVERDNRLAEIQEEELRQRNEGLKQRKKELQQQQIKLDVETQQLELFIAQQHQFEELVEFLRILPDLHKQHHHEPMIQAFLDLKGDILLIMRMFEIIIPSLTTSNENKKRVSELLDMISNSLSKPQGSMFIANAKMESKDIDIDTVQGDIDNIANGKKINQTS